MKEIRDIVKAFDDATACGLTAALATVVLVEGSAYRRAGARMLITSEGQLTGAISGGCLEGDALRKARLVMENQEAMLVTYDTTDDDDATLGIGLGCSGVIHILIEPIKHTDRHNPIQLLKAVLAERQYSVLITLFSLDNRRGPQPGTCLALTANGQRLNNLTDTAFTDILFNDAANVLKSKTSVIQKYASDIEYTGFVELIEPFVVLIIVGAGNDAIPLTQMASILGWESIVIDGRPAYAQAARFPLAKQVIVARPDQVCPAIIADERTVMVLMTHNYNYELTLLKHLLPMGMVYTGILGPKKKMERMIKELSQEGVLLTDEQLLHIYSPVGLDIGAEGAEEIALSIIAEIKSVLAKKSSRPLKYRSDPIHLTGIPVTQL